MSVVLPAPFGPMIAWVSPSSTSRSIRSDAVSAPKVFVSPRIWSSGSAIARAPRQEAEESAPREEDDDDEERPEDDLPVGGPRREQVLEEQQHGGADDRAGERAHPAEDHHEHDLA